MSTNDEKPKPTKDANLFKTDARDERMSNPSFMRTEHRIKELKRRQISKDAIDHCNNVAALYAECVKGARTTRRDFMRAVDVFGLREAMRAVEPLTRVRSHAPSPTLLARRTHHQRALLLPLAVSRS